MSIDIMKLAKPKYSLGLFNISGINNAFETYKDYLKLNELTPDKYNITIGDVIDYLNYLVNVEYLSDRVSENNLVSKFNILPIERKEPSSLLFVEYLVLLYESEITPFKPNKDAILRYKNMPEFKAISSNIKYIPFWNYIGLLLPFYNLDFILNHIDLVLDGNEEYRRKIFHLVSLKELVKKSLREFINISLKHSIEFVNDRIVIMEFVNSDTITLKTTDSIYKLMIDFIDNNGERFLDVLEEKT